MEAKEQAMPRKRITLSSIVRRKELAQADFLDSWAKELRDSNSPDLLAEACRMEREADVIRYGTGAA